MKRLVACSLAWIALLAMPASAQTSALLDAQMAETAALPEAPLPVTAPASSLPTQQDAPQAQPARQLPVPLAGDLLYAPLATGPETMADRFRLYAILTYGPRALTGRAIRAGIRMAHPPAGYPDEWRQGMQAYGRIFGDELATEISTNTTRAGLAALIREDYRYRPSESDNFFLRTGHALAFTVVDRNDNGHWQPAISNFAGAFAGGYVGNAYLPAGYNDVTHADQRALHRMAGFAISNVLREFVPDIYHATQRLGIPFPRIPVPAWWTRWDAADGTPAGGHH